MRRLGQERRPHVVLLHIVQEQRRPAQRDDRPGRGRSSRRAGTPGRRGGVGRRGRRLEGAHPGRIRAACASRCATRGVPVLETREAASPTVMRHYEAVARGRATAGSPSTCRNHASPRPRQLDARLHAGAVRRRRRASEDWRCWPSTPTAWPASSPTLAAMMLEISHDEATVAARGATTSSSSPSKPTSSSTASNASGTP